LHWITKPTAVAINLQRGATWVNPKREETSKADPRGLKMKRTMMMMMTTTAGKTMTMAMTATATTTTTMTRTTTTTTTPMGRPLEKAQTPGRSRKKG
jgi:hypothetical protein